MDNLKKLGFDNWYKDKVDLIKTTDFWSSIPSGKIARVISINKTTKSLGWLHGKANVELGW